MSKEGAEQRVHDDWKATQIQSVGVLFAMVHESEGHPAISLKTSPALVELLREQHADVFPGAYLNKTHWSTRRVERFSDLLRGVLKGVQKKCGWHSRPQKSPSAQAAGAVSTDSD